MDGESREMLSGFPPLTCLYKLLPPSTIQVHPVQKRRVVREAAGRPAALQGRPAGLEEPAGILRQPPQLRS